MKFQRHPVGVDFGGWGIYWRTINPSYWRFDRKWHTTGLWFLGPIGLFNWRKL
jgi:hypothetical protein